MESLPEAAKVLRDSKVSRDIEMQRVDASSQEQEKPCDICACDINKTEKSNNCFDPTDQELLMEEADEKTLSKMLKDVRIFVMVIHLASFCQEMIVLAVEQEHHDSMELMLHISFLIIATTCIAVFLLLSYVVNIKYMYPVMLIKSLHTIIDILDLVEFSHSFSSTSHACQLCIKAQFAMVLGSMINKILKGKPRVIFCSTFLLLLQSAFTYEFYHL